MWFIKPIEFHVLCYICYIKLSCPSAVVYFCTSIRCDVIGLLSSVIVWLKQCDLGSIRVSAMCRMYHGSQSLSAGADVNAESLPSYKCGFCCAGNQATNLDLAVVEIRWRRVRINTITVILWCSNSKYKHHSVYKQEESTYSDIELWV